MKIPDILLDKAVDLTRLPRRSEEVAENVFWVRDGDPRPPRVRLTEQMRAAKGMLPIGGGSTGAYSISTGSYALTAAATKSFWNLNAGTITAVTTEMGWSFDGSAAAAGILIDVYRITTLGSPAGTAPTFIRRDGSDPSTPSMTGCTKLTTEPTTVEIQRSWYVSPASGMLVLQFPLGRELRVPGAGSRIGSRYTTPAAVSPNAVSYIEAEE